MPKPKPSLRARSATHFRNHPAIAWGTLAAIFTILGVIVPGGWFVWRMLELAEHASATYETKIDSSAKFAEAIGRIEKVNSDLVGTKRNAAWLFVGQARMDVTALRNRVNDCDIRKEKHETMSALERAACSQYQQEFADAQRRFIDAQTTANNVSR